MGKRGYKPTPAPERFWRKVQKTDGCWIWTAAKNPHGYGMFMTIDGAKLAHRFSWEMASGVDPGEQCILHRCDNPSCVRPDHLFIGTQLDNMRDMNTKGRHGGGAKPGEGHFRAKLTWSDVLEIRKEETSDNLLALRFGVSRSTIYSVRTGKSWTSEDLYD